MKKSSSQWWRCICIFFPSVVSNSTLREVHISSLSISESHWSNLLSLPVFSALQSEKKKYPSKK